MKIGDIKPFVRQAVLTKMTMNGRISYPLKTKDHRLFYIQGGTGSIVIEGKNYEIKSGMLVLFRSGTEYIWQVTGMRYLALNFDLTEAHNHLTRSFHVHRSESVGALLEGNLTFSDTDALDKPIILYGMASYEPMISSIISEFHLPDGLSPALISATMKHLILSIIRRLGEQRSDKGEALVRDVIGYIEENYTRPIRNTEIAEALHFNPSYMNRVFRERTGTSIRAFLIDYRINAATDLILSGALPVSELALAVGFTDVPHFIKTFKTHTGKTPTEFKSRS